MQKTWLRNKKADPQIEETPDSSVHRCREKKGVNPMSQHEVPHVEKGQRPLDQGALLEECLEKGVDAGQKQRGRLTINPGIHGR